MNTTEKKLERQVHIWALLGPFLMLLAIFLITFKAPSDHLNLPLAALIGLVLCWKWKLRGLAVSIGILAATIVYQYAGIPVEERLWLIGISMAISLAFVVTALSFEEIESIMQGMEVESNSRLDNLLQLDEKLKSAQDIHQAETKQWALKIESLQKEYAETKGRLESYEKLVNIVRGELVDTHAQQEKLLEEVFQKRHETALIQEKLDTAQNEIKSLAAKNIEENCGQSSHQSGLQAKHDHELLLLQSQVEEAQAAVSSAVKKSEEYRQELSAAKELLESANSMSQQTQDEQLVQQAVVQEMSDHIETLSREKDLLSTTLEKLQKEFESLRSEDQQKNHLIEETRNKLAQATQQLVHWQEQMANFSSLNTKLEHTLAQLATKESENKSLDRQLADARFERESLVKQLADSQSEREPLIKKLAEIQSDRESLVKQFAHIQSERESLRESLTKLAEERSVIQEKTTEPQTLPVDGSQRRAEGMYLQLREQFNEKSAVLDETRRELFHTQEKLQVLQRELEEALKYDRSEWEAALEKYLQQLEKEYTQDTQYLQDEIDAMKELISSLVSGNKKSYNAFSKL